MSPVWTNLGDPYGTDTSCTTDTNATDPGRTDCGEISSCFGGPGCAENGSVGSGVWVRSAIDLSGLAGREARIRWVTNVAGGGDVATSRSFQEPGPGISFVCLTSLCQHDEGWWIDDLVITGLRETSPPCDADVDEDGVTICESDCDDLDSAIWDAPGVVDTLAFSPDGQTLTWSPPSEPGTLLPLYDVICSPDPSDFEGGATCLVTDDPATSAMDPTAPLPGQTLHYIIRAQSLCPNGTGPVGPAPGAARSVRACP